MILGGTVEARDLAARLAAKGADAVTSLAGRATRPAYPGKVRVGGFGGAAGLRDYLATEGVAVVVDATHPFAAVMSPNAAVVCAELGVEYLRLERPEWRPAVGDDWRDAASLEEAAEMLPLASRAFLAVGAQSLPPFLRRTDAALIVRSIVRPDGGEHPNITMVEAKGPFTVEGERALFQAHRVEVIVAKNAGGRAADAKLVAARELGLPVIMVRRPAGQPAADAATPEAIMVRLQPHL